MNSNVTYAAMWLLASLVGIFMALQFDTAAFVDGQYIPVGNDSFYHARRILDAAIGERGFYEFDSMIHVPEGSWICWPWGYDFLMAQALVIALWLKPALDPMAFLAHVPVSWVFVNTGLFVLLGRQIGLGVGFAAIASLGFAILPLNQNLHGIGSIDHHYIELTFVLATVLAGLRFFSGGKRTKDAVVLGMVLGVAPAFHNGLFILQIPVLICAFVLWSRQISLEHYGTRWLAGSLIAATLLITLPSAPFREMQFEFWTLSWFHLYVAVCSSVFLAYLGWRPTSKMNFAVLIALSGILILPIFAKMLIGSAFLTGDLILLDQILEVKSPLERLREPGGLIWVTNYYSWLIFLTPLLILIFAIRAWRSTDPVHVYFSIFAVFGSLLMLTQFRLHPFGSWVLLLGSLLLIDSLRSRFGVSLLVASAVSLLTMAIAFQPSLRNQLFYKYAPGGTLDYAASRSLFPILAEECSRNGGTVFSYSDDGHYIRYHTDCSVLTNNFLLTPLHERKILEGNALLQMTPEQFLGAAPHIKYIFVRMYGTFDNGPDGWKPVSVPEVIARNSPLFVELTFSQNIPEAFRLVDEIPIDDERDFAYARIFEIVRN